MSPQRSDRSVVGNSITAVFEWYDEHPFFYSACIGVVMNFFYGPKFEPVSAACLFGGLVGGLWSVGKAFLITGNTISTMRANGEPLFKAGGLTEYDSEMTRRIAEEIVKAQRQSTNGK